MRLILLAAGSGRRLMPLTEHRPKTMVELHGRPLVCWIVDAARRAGIDDFVIVAGPHEDQLHALGLPARIIANPHHARTNMVASLACAESLFNREFVVSYADIVYNPDVLSALLAETAPIAVAVDDGWEAYWRCRCENVLDDAEVLKFTASGLIAQIGQKPRSIDEIESQYVGLLKFRDEGVVWLRELFAEQRAAESDGVADSPRRFDDWYMTDLLQILIDRGRPLTPVRLNGGWLEIDTLADLHLAGRLSAGSRCGWLHVQR